MDSTTSKLAQDVRVPKNLSADHNSDHPEAGLIDLLDSPSLPGRTGKIGSEHEPSPWGVSLDASSSVDTGKTACGVGDGLNPLAFPDLPRPNDGGAALHALKCHLPAASRRLHRAYGDQCVDHRYLKRLHRSTEHLSPEDGTLSTPNVFWASTAVPLASTFEQRMRRVIDAEVALVRPLVGSVYASSLVTGGSDPGPQFREETAEELITDLVAGSLVPTRRHIDGVGRWWLQRLRRAAIRSTWDRLATAPVSQLDQMVADAELELAGSAPWAYSDRVLSAFEHAHTNLVHYATAQIKNL